MNLKQQIYALTALSLAAMPDEQDHDWESIEREYKLIKKKKSKLPRSVRDRIIRLWQNRLKNKSPL